MMQGEFLRAGHEGMASRCLICATFEYVSPLQVLASSVRFFVLYLEPVQIRIRILEVQILSPVYFVNSQSIFRFQDL